MRNANKLAEKILDHALKFHHTVLILRARESVDGDGYIATVMIPAMFLSALTSELMLKVLHLLDHGDSARGHHLEKLFDRLNGSTQVLIAHKWQHYVAREEQTFARIDKEIGEEIARDLRGALKNGSYSFNELRYFYEGERQSNFYLMELPSILWEVIVERRPEWRYWNPASMSLGQVK